MKRTNWTRFILGAVAGLALMVGSSTFARGASSLQGDYLEVRSCDVFTGACVANSEMGLSGREGILVWTVRQGEWNGIRLDGLSVIAVVTTAGTLGDLRYEPRQGRGVVIVDANAGPSQREALTEFARSAAGSLLAEVVQVRTAPVVVSLGGCRSGACATVQAGEWVDIKTRCLGGQDHLCGNEENYYPPLTRVQEPRSAMTDHASYLGRDLGLTWTLSGKRSAYLASFAW